VGGMYIIQLIGGRVGVASLSGLCWGQFCVVQRMILLQNRLG
jgi:hypothetical protein